MLHKSKYIVLICGVSSIAVTVIFYLLAFKSIFTIPINWVSLMFLVFAEVTGTIKVFAVKKNIFGISNIVTSIVHIISVLVISIIFVNIFPFLIKKYILLNILLLCILSVIDIIIVFFYNHITKQNRKLSESQSVMRYCVKKATSLYMEFCNTEHKKRLEELVELLKYSDNSCLSQDEETIMRKLDELELQLKNNDDHTVEKITEIENVIKLRSIKVASAKHGRY